MRRLVQFHLLVWLLVCFSKRSCPSLFTSVAHLEKVADMEQELVNSIEEYIKLEEVRLNELGRNLRRIEKQRTKANENVTEFVVNPINSYLLIKRIHLDWQEAISNTEKLVTQNHEEFKSKMFHHEDKFMATEEDLKGASSALMRLQETYKIDIKDFTRGVIRNNSGASLSAMDLFDIGLVAYEQGDFYHAILWFEEAADAARSSDLPELTDILEYLAFAYNLYKDFFSAKQVTEEILEINPEHENALENLVIFKGDIEDMIGRGEEIEKKPLIRPLGGKFYQDTYEALCRGERKMSMKEQAKLKCYYNNNEHPYLKIQPVKMEVLNFKPWVVLFYEVCSDKDTDYMKKAAFDNLQRSHVTEKMTGQGLVTDYRVSSGTFLEFPTPDPHPILKKLNRRIEYITGLSTYPEYPRAHSESFQVVNYGIGGVYEAHYDHAIIGENDEDVYLRGSRNRIATWMFYLSDVEEGGYTVFPLADAYVPPVKNAAVFWYNLKKSGEGDDLTRHAGCPVLIGSKWVSNKWIHEMGQEFRALCSKNQSEYFQSTVNY